MRIDASPTVSIVTATLIDAIAGAIEASYPGAPRAETLESLRNLEEQLPHVPEFAPFRLFTTFLLAVAQGDPTTKLEKSLAPELLEVYRQVKRGTYSRRERSTPVLGVYYPGAIIPEDLLKGALLYFDKIRVFVPGQWNFDQSNLDRFLEDTKVLQEEGLLELVSLRAQTPKAPPMTKTEDGHINMEDPATSQYFQHVVADALAGLASAFETGDEHDDTLVDTQFGYLFHLMREGEVPVSGSPTAQAALYKKFSELASSSELEPVREAIEHDFKVALTLKTALDQRLPSLCLRSYDDLLEARWRLGDALGQCKDAVANVIKDLRLNPFHDHNESLQKAVQLINSGVTDLERKLSTEDDRFVRGLYREGAAGVLALVATVAVGTPIPLLFLLNNLKNIEALRAELAAKKKELRDENGLSLLLSIGDRVR